VKVSIIIVNYNGSQHLQDLFRSIRELEYPKEQLEVIFFDNGSADDSLEKLSQEYPEARVIANPENLGFAPPHRIAAKKAKGEVLAFLNNDMKVHPGWVSEGLSYLDPDQGVVCAGSRILSWDGRSIDFSGGSLQYLGYAENFHKDVISDGAPILFPCGGAMFISRKVFLEAGCFDDDYFAIFEDVDLGWRLWVMGYKVVMAKRSIAYHKGHATLDSRHEFQKRYLMHKNALITIIKNYEEENLKTVLPAAMSLALKRALLFLGVNKRQFYFWDDNDGKITLTKNSIEGLVHLVVLDDVFEEFEGIILKRDQVQAKRRREDKEILDLFRDPLRNIMGFKEYFWLETSLMGRFELHELFKCNEQYQKNLTYGLGLARQDLDRIRREISRIIMEDSRIKRSPARLGSILQRFNQKKREQGIINALRHSVLYCLEWVKRKK
jgi:GT2 family glycosyltransferase